MGVQLLLKYNKITIKILQSIITTYIPCIHPYPSTSDPYGTCPPLYYPPCTFALMNQMNSSSNGPIKIKSSFSSDSPVQQSSASNSNSSYSNGDNVTVM